MEDNEYNEVLHFVSSNNYPKRINEIKDHKLKKNEKKKVRSKCQNLRISDGMLYKGNQRLLRKSEVPGVLQTMHAGQYAGGHLGRDKTYDKIRKHYSWKGMKDDVRLFVRNCDRCTRINIAPPNTAPPLNSIPVPTKIWSLVGIDIIGPFQTSLSGKKYIVAATDHFSKWSVAAAIPNKSADSVSKFILQMICTYGPMDSIITDQGKEFTNKVVDALTDALQIEHRISSPYHPQTNGQRERDNRTLKEMLSKYVNENGDNWDELLECCMFAYRTSRHSSTKFSPFSVMFGREPKIVKQESVEACEFGTNHITSDGLQTIVSVHKTLNEKVAENIGKAQSHQKRNYDRRNKSHQNFEMGTHVLIKNANKIRRFGGKLEPRWVGPYKVVQVLTKGRVRLENVSSKKVLKNVYHCSNLKRYTASASSEGEDVKQQRDSKPRRIPKRVTQAKLKSTKRLNSAKRKLKQKRVIGKHSRAFVMTTIEVNKELCKKLKISFLEQPKYEQMNNARPRYFKKIKGDGNCFFRSIAFAVSGSENGYNQVRRKVVSHMQKKSKQLQGYLNQNVNRYLDQSNMVRDGIWATDAEIIGTASLLQTDICVHCKNGNRYSWLRYPASFSLEKKTEQALYLANRTGDHFEVVLGTF